MKSLKSLAIAGIIVCSMSAVALAAPPAAKNPAANETVINYTDAQRDQYAKLYADYETKTMPLHDSMMAKRMELRAIEGLQGTTQADVQKLIGEITALRGQIRAEQQNFNAALTKAGLPSHGGYHRGMGMGMGMGMMGGDGMDCPGMGQGKTMGGPRGKGHGPGHGYGRMGNMY